MPNDMFRFKRFTISQDQCAMKVGTDGVLLGCWASLHTHAKVLDIGTGTGLLALMAAQRGAAKVDAVEIMPEAASQAFDNVTKSPWSEIIEVHTCDIKHFQPHCKYDYIWSNPPFYENPLMPSDKARSIARNTQCLSIGLLAESVARLLLVGGVFSVILPTDVAGNMETALAGKCLYLSKKTLVQTRIGKPPRRMLMEFSHKVTQTIENTLILTDEHGERTKEYDTLTKDFYLTHSEKEIL